jgi:hypothetical protein
MVKVKAHRCVPWDKRVNRGNPTQEGEQAGDKTFGVICQRERVFPKSLAKPRSGGETPSRTESSCPARRSRADNVLSDKDVTQPLTLTLSRRGRGDCSPVQCAPLIGTLPVSRRGRGDRSPVQCAPLIGTLPISRRGRGNCHHGAMRSAYWHPTSLPQGGRGWLPRTITLR